MLAEERSNRVNGINLNVLRIPSLGNANSALATSGLMPIITALQFPGSTAPNRR